MRARHPGVLHFCDTTTAGARHCTSLIYSGRRPNQYMQGFLVRAVGGARESEQTPAENLRSQSRPPAGRSSRPRCIGARRKDDRVSSSLRKQKNSLTARAADVSLRLPPSRWLLAGAKPPPGPSPRSPVPADRLLRGATGTGSVSLTPGPPTVQGEPGIDYGGSRRTRSPLAGILRPTETSPTDRSNGYRRRPPE